MSANERDAVLRRSRTRPTPTGKRVTPQERDLLWFANVHEHGPLSTSFLHGFSKHRWTSEKRAKERLTDLFHENNTPHGGAYLTRPHQQFRTIDSRYNELVYDLLPAAEAALKKHGLYQEYRAGHTGPWLHRYMVSCITASIELATLDNPNLAYIPGSTILAQAKATLRFPTEIEEPDTGYTYTKDLIPDAVFGLEYKQGNQRSYRFFALEADRGTEPTTTANFNRKSHLRTLLQYRDYIGAGGYKEHLNLTAPLLVLNVFSDAKKCRKVQELAADLGGGRGSNYLLFQTFPDFGGAFRPPRPNRALLTEPWERAGEEPFNIARE